MTDPVRLSSSHIQRLLMSLIGISSDRDTARIVSDAFSSDDLWERFRKDPVRFYLYAPHSVQKAIADHINDNCAICYGIELGRIEKSMPDEGEDLKEFFEQTAFSVNFAAEMYGWEAAEITSFIFLEGDEIRIDMKAGQTRVTADDITAFYEAAHV